MTYIHSISIAGVAFARFVCSYVSLSCATNRRTCAVLRLPRISILRVVRFTMALSPQARRIIFIVISSVHVLCGLGLFIDGLTLLNHDLYSYGPGLFASFEGLAALICFGWYVRMDDDAVHACDDLAACPARLSSLILFFWLFLLAVFRSRRVL